MISRGRPWSRTRRRNVTEPLARPVRLPSRKARETVRGVRPASCGAQPSPALSCTLSTQRSAPGPQVTATAGIPYSLTVIRSSPSPPASVIPGARERT